MSYGEKAAKAGRIPVQIVEIDQDYCNNVYGTSPCTASVGTTGTQKCFNTYGTCQDTAHFNQGTKTYSFCSRNAALPVGVQAWPLVNGVSMQPQQLTPGKGLGVRASVTVTFADMPDTDAMTDPYLSTRGYDPLKQGTFWPKFWARNRFYFGRFLRVKSGYIDPAGFSTGDFITREYVIDSIKGPDRSGIMTVVAKDVLKLADDKLALCPKPNTGVLAGDITSTASGATLSPAGIGDAEYPSSGRLIISKEGIDFTRSGDTLTFTARNVYATGQEAHNLGDTVQVVKVYNGQYIDEVLADLLVNYGNIPSSYVDTAAWAAERTAFLSGTWSTDICEPTGVNTLIGELTQQGLCDIWTDEINQKVRFQAMRPPGVGMPVYSDENHFLQGSISPSEDLSQRISTVVVYFGRIDPTRSLSDQGNFITRYVDADPTSAGAFEWGTNSVTTIYSRWFTQLSLGRVETLSQTLLQRFTHPPRMFDFKIDAKDALYVGDLIYASTRGFQDVNGNRVPVNMMVIKSQEDKPGSSYACTAQEMVYNEDILTTSNLVVISVDALNVDLYSAYVAEFGTPTVAVTVTFHVLPGVTIGSASPSLPSLTNTTAWPGGSTITLKNEGSIYGAGGSGGTGGNGAYWHVVGHIDTVVNATAGAPGGAGGDALHATYALTIDNSAGTIAGGGGGGGGGGGAGMGPTSSTDIYGGAGGGGGGGEGSNSAPASSGGPGAYGGNSYCIYSPYSVTGAPGANGSDTAAGTGGAHSPHYSNETQAGGTGGTGGALGTAGSAGVSPPSPTGGGTYTPSAAGGAGGAAGKAIVGNSYITWTATGTRIGAIT